MHGLYQWGSTLPSLSFYAFIFAWLFIESTGFPISDEPLLLFAGSLAAVHRIQFVPVIAVALVGKVLASCLAYAIGRRFDLERLARPAVRPSGGIAAAVYYIRPTQAFAKETKRRFRRQGVWGVFLGRLIPVVRSFISYPAGAARMPFATFLLATTAGSLIWITFWTVLGAGLGHSYKQAAARWGSVSWLVLLAFLAIIGAVWFWNHRHFHRNIRDNSSSADSHSGSQPEQPDAPARRA